MDMIDLDNRRQITDNLHHVVHQRFKQRSTHIVIILIKLLMRVDTSLGMPFRRRTPDLLIEIAGVLIDTDPINLVLNIRLDIL